jgi:hypothetical protein
MSPAAMDDINDRIEKLKQQADAVTGGKMQSGFSPDCPPEMQERFCKQALALAFEATPAVEPLQKPVESGMTLPSPEALEDTALTSKLWEVIDGLAAIGIYLFFTDHLSDRELYERLWRDVLRDPMELTDDDGAAWHVDMSSGGSEEDTLVYLKYYADDDARRRWAQEWPNDPLPPAEDPPFDRDRRLPQAFAGEESSPGD